MEVYCYSINQFTLISSWAAITHLINNLYGTNEYEDQSMLILLVTLLLDMFGP